MTVGLGWGLLPWWMTRDLEEIQRKVIQIKMQYDRWTYEEVTEACREVCSHWPLPSIRVLSMIEAGNEQLVKEFIAVLPPFERGDYGRCYTSSPCTTGRDDQGS